MSRIKSLKTAFAIAYGFDIVISARGDLLMTENSDILRGGARDGSRELKKRLGRVLESADEARRNDELSKLDPRKAISPLLSFLLSREPTVRWRAVEAIGFVVSRLAETDREAARVVMRRLMWQLNDESGGIGWGCPEAMGEIMAVSRALAEEYAHVLRSYVDEKGNFLEYEPLQEGALWGLARLASAHPDLVKGAMRNICKFLTSPRPELRALALLCIMRVKGLPEGEEIEVPEGLLEDDSLIEIYDRGAIGKMRVGELARGVAAFRGPKGN